MDMRETALPIARRSGVMEEADMEPRLGYTTTRSADDAQEWARTARMSWGVPVRVFARTLSAGGVHATVWVAIVWPTGSKRKATKK